MKNNDEKSYERYKQYRLNRYRYEWEQKMIPIYIIIGGAIIIGLWKYILIAIGLISVLGVAVLVLYFYLKKQVRADQPIVLTEEDAKEGVNVTANITYNSKTACVKTRVPPNAKDGQKIVVKNVLFQNKKGKPVKKNVHLTIRVK